MRYCGYRGRVRRRTGGIDEARAGSVNTHDSAWMPARVGAGRADCGRVGLWRGERAGKSRWQAAGSGRPVAGSREFRRQDAGLMADSRVDSREIRGLCFLYSSERAKARHADSDTPEKFLLDSTLFPIFQVKPGQINNAPAVE